MGSVAYMTSTDGKYWSPQLSINDSRSAYGLQKTVYRGELYGIEVYANEDKPSLYATKFINPGYWENFRSLPEKFKSQGRVAVAVLDDRFFVAYRGTNDHVYLIWTEDFDTWHDAGRVGSKYAKTNVAPGLAAYDGKLWLTGVGDDKYIYYTTVDRDGQRLKSWAKIDGTGTQSALSMAVYDSDLYLFHTGYENKNFFWQKSTKDGWSDLKKVDAPSINSGVSAVSWKMNSLFVTYRGTKQEIQTQSFDGKEWSGENAIPNYVKMLAQTGLGTWGGRLFVSYAVDTSFVGSLRSAYQVPGSMSMSMSMNEKGAFVDEQEVSEWDVKWKQQEDSKSLVRKFFCL